MANIFKSTSTALTTSTQDIYQAPAAGVGVILSIYVANVDGGTSADLTLIKTDGSNNPQSELVHTIPVPADTSLEVVANKIVLMADEKLRGYAGNDNFLQATVSVLEIT